MMDGSAGRKTLFVGRFISTPGPNDLLIQQGAILVSSQDGHGTISKVDWTVSTPAEALSAFSLEDSDVHDTVITSEDGFFFPGFIDTHIHAPQYPNAGIFGKSTLLDWLTTYTFPLEASLGGEGPLSFEKNNKPQKIDHVARSKHVYDKVVSRTLSNGTTTASYFATLSVESTNLLADVAHRAGQRAYIGRVCMDHPETCPEYYRDESPAQTISNARDSIAHIHKLDSSGVLLAPIVTPRFAPSCQEETLSLLGALAKENNLRIQTHISENTNELKLVKLLYPERASYTDVYDHAGLLTDRTILAHGIHLSDEEISTIKARGSKISHCPASNSALGSGFCPVRKLLENGIDVSLGTDVSGGYSTSILDCVRQACLVSRQLGYVNDSKKWNIGITEGLWLATVGGARSVGLGKKLGGFEVGMYWDVQEVVLDEKGQVDVFGWESWEELIDKWVWNGDDRNVRKVWVGGRLVHSRG